jgi:hypothetical protein
MKIGAMRWFFGSFDGAEASNDLASTQPTQISLSFPDSTTTKQSNYILYSEHMPSTSHPGRLTLSTYSSFEA